MTRREDYLSRIHRMFSLAEIELENQGKKGLNNGNIVWEDIANRILNICFSYNTINLNQEKANYPGIDLGNRENGIGIQVTRRNDAAKVKNTIETVLRNHVYKMFPKLKIFILGRKKEKYALDCQSWEQCLQFDAKRDIMDFDTIRDCCQSMETETLQKLAEYLEWELKCAGPVNQSIEKINAYMKQVKKENSHILIIGLGKQLPIEKAWIQLQLIKKDDLLEMEACKKDRGIMLTAYHEYSSRQEEVYDVEAVLETNRNTVVLAGPGMGKSTLCKKLLFIAVRSGYRAIKVSLMDVAGYMRDEQSFDEALRRAMVQSLEFHLEKEEMEGQFKFLFLDGLDECGDIRRKVAQDISAWSAGHPSVKIVLTSRPIGYDFSHLQDFEHLEIQTLNPDDLNFYVRRILEELELDQPESCMEWFEKQLEHREIKNLACRSPLLLGFLLQMSIRKKYFGQYRCELYGQILLEWLQRSSRENEKKISESELLRGIEIIAFYMLSHVNEMYKGAYTKTKIAECVGTAFEEELECCKLAGMQKAEICVDFWTERGILDRDYYHGEERYLFLHLNIGEYLAGRYISRMTEKDKRAWIDSHYRQSIWHESVRMAISCEKELSIVEKLLDIEQSNRLPNGSIFLAAEGVGEKRSSKVPQALYDKLLEYLQTDNPYLSNKAAKAMWRMESKSLDWHREILLGLIQSDIAWIHDAAYSVYLRIPVEEQDYEILRNFMIGYGKNPDRGYRRLAYDNMEETVKRLRTNERDLQVIDAVKHIYYDHCSVAGMKILQEYLEQIGEKEWAAEYYRQKSGRFADFDFMGAHQRLWNSERMLIQTLADMYGVTEVKNLIEICPEYSKLTQVIDLMETPVSELMVLQYDLLKNYSKSILNAACIAGGIQVDRLKEEIYCLLKNGDNTDESIFHQMRRNLSVECVWERTEGLVPVAHILEGLCSKSDILGIPSALIALANSEIEGMKAGIRYLLFHGNSNVMPRVGWLVPILFKENSMRLMLERLDCDDLPCYCELYDNLAKCQGLVNWDQWLRVVEKGLLSDKSDVVKAVLKYLLTGLKETCPENFREQLLNTVKQQFELWLGKEIICLHCKSGAILAESGFCPDCHVGGDLPLGLFMEVLVAFQRCTKEELITYTGYKNSDMSKAARAGLKLILEQDGAFLDVCLDSLKSGRVPDYVFSVILDLPSPNLKDRKELILRLASGEETGLALDFMKKLNNQEWLSEQERKDYLEKMIDHPESTLRSQAMACWLGDDTFYNFL
ncbi:SMEK domain-containing protein [Desulfitobacterium sp. AusDCA]|uniref:SMEK domain-containing protein n=1 Tax=Desulfitobacterium sp. AusDCA TaxID=3240383 RepID=UPI003DA73DB2